MEIESVKYWKDATRKETRVYVNFKGGASACWYCTGNKWNAAKSWTYDRCTAEDVAEVRKNPLAYENGRWLNYSNYAKPAKRQYSYSQLVDRAVRGHEDGIEDARFDLDVEREFNRRKASFHYMGDD